MSIGELSTWLERKYLEWQLENGRDSVAAFARHLGVQPSLISMLMTGERKSTSRKTALRIAQRLGDFEILDILGYARPEPEELLAGFPAEIADPLLAAIAEARAELDARGITTGGDAAEEIVRAAFERHGVSVTFTRRGFED